MNDILSIDKWGTLTIRLTPEDRECIVIPRGDYELRMVLDSAGHIEIKATTTAMCANVSRYFTIQVYFDGKMEAWDGW